ncbi:hypothetical protein AcV7_002560 [Taiwanofungus camphoratus]|nr:hypothetical protein AcV7_002560 [Antrodia cinnamomea]
MSSVTSSATLGTSTVTSVSSSSSTNNSSGESFGPSVPFPFGFLISFVAIFLFFLVCGFSSHRLSTELRRHYVIPLHAGRAVSQTCPVLWVPHTPSLEDGQDQWAATMVSAVPVIRQVQVVLTDLSLPRVPLPHKSQCIWLHSKSLSVRYVR